MQRDISVVLCGLETSLSPHTVLYNEVAQRVPLASEAQVRVRGSPHPLDGLSRDVQEPERASNQRHRALGTWPTYTYAFAFVDAEIRLPAYALQAQPIYGR